MRYEGVQSAGKPTFDYSAGTIKRLEKEKEDDPIRNIVNTATQAINNIGNFLAQGITNPQAADNNSGSSTAFRQ